MLFPVQPAQRAEGGSMFPIEKCQDFFLKAMSKTWAGGVEGIPDPGMPGYERYAWHDDDFLLVDSFCSNAQTGSFLGTTTIFGKNDPKVPDRFSYPVWAMQYHGETPDILGRFVRAALLDCYSKRQFNGGRGWRRFSDPEAFPEIEYENLIEKGDFSCFSGEEQIFYYGNTDPLAALRERLPRHRPVGWCKYGGKILV